MKSVLFEMTVNNIMRMIAGKRYYGDKKADLEVTFTVFSFSFLDLEKFVNKKLDFNWAPCKRAVR